MADLVPGELDDRERDAVETLLRTMADDEFVLGERYTEWQVRAPTLESDLALSNIAQDEYGHARLWYDCLQQLGATEADLIWEADPGDFRHATLVELPFDVTEGGDWADPILRGYLFDVYEDELLEALASSSYEPIRDRVGKVRAEEEYHLEHGHNWLERLCDDAPGREATQAALDRLFPHALTLFEPTAVEDDVVDLGVRPRSLADLRSSWLDRVVPALEELGLEVPVADGEPQVDPPAVTGRDGTHTDHWPDLHAEFTRTYRELGYEEPPRLMRGDDE